MSGFFLVCMDSPNQVPLNNADMQNIVTALRAADAAAGGTKTEYLLLMTRLVDAFADDLK